ncbi:YbaN family protein [Sphingomonas sp. S2-65]|uniref:YbaN family protein n=1 Tax=Sphingomonas sp. S2-65 TaxID=2903960 RepID=UPI001F3249D3|nr:YbaN family protein [Sphingomonas sp. S2-65]UYY60277.1 YbaN family protein [Sphingomonas sp. S2-65]
MGQEPSSPPGLARSRVARGGYLVLGLCFVGLGVIGAFLPVMPTTIFIILAAWSFGKSSPRLEKWLLDHRLFGPPLHAWRAEGAIPTIAKIVAVASMAGGYALFLWQAHPALWLAAGVAALLLACAAYVLSRPAPARR